MGSIVFQNEILELSTSINAGYTLLAAESAYYHHDMLQSNLEGFGTDVRVILEVGVITNANHYLQEQQERRLLVKAFEDVDVLVGPTLLITAPRIQPIH
ncbi:hypothetical protein [Virgibacillus tibetensis]